MINETLTVKWMQSQCAILLKVGESENVFTFPSTMCHIFMQIIIFNPWSPAGLWVGGNEVEDKTNHNPSSHDDTSVGQEGGVHCKQTWNKEYFISFLHSLHNYCRKFSINNNKASHSKINHFPWEMKQVLCQVRNEAEFWNPAVRKKVYFVMKHDQL